MSRRGDDKTARVHCSCLRRKKLRLCARLGLTAHRFEHCIQEQESKPTSGILRHAEPSLAITLSPHSLITLLKCGRNESNMPLVSTNESHMATPTPASPSGILHSASIISVLAGGHEAVQLRPARGDDVAKVEVPRPQKPPLSVTITNSRNQASKFPTSAKILENSCHCSSGYRPFDSMWVLYSDHPFTARRRAAHAVSGICFDWTASSFPKGCSDCSGHASRTFLIQNERLANGMERLQLSVMWRRNKDRDLDHPSPVTPVSIIAVENDVSANRHKLTRQHCSFITTYSRDYWKNCNRADPTWFLH